MAPADREAHLLIRSDKDLSLFVMVELLFVFSSDNDLLRTVRAWNQRLLARRRWSHGTSNANYAVVTDTTNITMKLAWTSIRDEVRDVADRLLQTENGDHGPQSSLQLTKGEHGRFDSGGYHKLENRRFRAHLLKLKEE